MTDGEDLISHQLDASLLRGLADLEDTGRGLLPHRLPLVARLQCDDAQLLGAESQPSGVRLHFRSAATVIELDVRRTRMQITGLPGRPDGTVDLRIDGDLVQQAQTTGGDIVQVDPATGATQVRPGEAAAVRFTDLPSVDKTVEIWLPHYERTELVALRTNAPISVDPVTTGRTWVHYGSSISQGSNAASPSQTWPALVATRAGVDLVNLGFSGSAMLDQFVARAIRDQPADLISVKIGINLVNSDLMRLRAFGPAVHGFLDTIRDGHPTTPLVVIGPLFCPIHENTPGPGAFDPQALADGQIRFIATGDPAEAGGPGRPLGRLTLVAIRRQLADIVEQRRAGDPALFLVDGLDLYGPDDETTHPLPDNLHPDAATHRLIASRFSEAAQRISPLWASPTPTSQ